MVRGKRIKEYRLLQALRRWMQPPPGLGLDFTQPAGAPALAPADGVSWRVFSNPVSLFIGGVSAVLLELAEPRVRTGVWDHSKFRQDPFARLHRTGYAAMVTVYAPVAHAQTMIARVVNMHARIRGHTPDGTPYHANDPQLLNWVQATAIFGFTEAFHRYVQALPVHAKDAAFAEGQASARLYGAHGLPADWKAWETLLDATAPNLEGSEILEEFLAIMRSAPILPAPLRPLQRLLVRAAIDMTPAPVREWPQLQGQGLRRGERMLVRALGTLARLLPLPHLPPAQARRRMGIRD